MTTPNSAPLSATQAVPNDPAAVERAQSQLVQAVETMGYPKAAVFAIRLAVQEACANAFNHGHKDLPPTATIEIAYQVSADEVRITVTDQGPGFDPASIPDPTLDENLEQPSGRGLLLMRAYMTSVEYSDKGNQLRMYYRRPAKG